MLPRSELDHPSPPARPAAEHSAIGLDRDADHSHTRRVCLPAVFVAGFSCSARDEIDSTTKWCGCCGPSSQQVDAGGRVRRGDPPAGRGRPVGSARVRARRPLQPGALRNDAPSTLSPRPDRRRIPPSLSTPPASIVAELGPQHPHHFVVEVDLVSRACRRSRRRTRAGRQTRRVCCDRRLDRDRIAECSAGGGERERRMITAADRGSMAGPVERVTTTDRPRSDGGDEQSRRPASGCWRAGVARTDDGSSPSGLRGAAAAACARGGGDGGPACRSCAGQRDRAGRSFKGASSRLVRRRERRSCAYLTTRRAGPMRFRHARIAYQCCSMTSRSRCRRRGGPVFFFVCHRSDAPAALHFARDPRCPCSRSGSARSCCSNRALCSVCDGASPKSALYSPANRPSRRIRGRWHVGHGLLDAPRRSQRTPNLMSCHSRSSASGSSCRRRRRRCAGCAR